jgi:altronate dehydratase
MTVMEINIEDSDIANTHQSSQKKEEPKKDKKDLTKSVVPFKPPSKVEPPTISKNPSTGNKKGGYGNLFG